MKTFTIASLLAFAAALGAVGCTPSSPAECEAIVERCHPLDPGSGPIHECHEYAEAEGRTAAECSAMQTSCFATCVASDAGTDSGNDVIATGDGMTATDAATE